MNLGIISRVSITEFHYQTNNLHFETEDRQRLGMLSYRRGARTTMKGYVLKLETDSGLSGEFVPYMGGTEPALAEAKKLASRLLNQSPLDIRRIADVLKIAARAGDGAGAGLWDIALWDLCGKALQLPIYSLMGGAVRKRLPTYVSTWRGDRAGGLDSPSAFADFAKECLKRNAIGFKVHSWPEAIVKEEVAMVQALGRELGGKLELMLDPACVYRTYSDTLRVGRACDAAGFLWLEDPLCDIGRSFDAHRRLRQALTTEIVQGERIRGLEEKANLIQAEATDRLRADPEMDGGISGMLKIAALAEAFGMDLEIANCSPAQRHCFAALRNANYYEICNVGPDCPNATPPIYLCGYADQLEAIEADGCVAVPEGHGLGVRYDWDYIREHTLSTFELTNESLRTIILTPQ